MSLNIFALPKKFSKLKVESCKKNVFNYIILFQIFILSIFVKFSDFFNDIPQWQCTFSIYIIWLNKCLFYLRCHVNIKRKIFRTRITIVNWRLIQLPIYICFACLLILLLFFHYYKNICQNESTERKEKSIKNLDEHISYFRKWFLTQMIFLTFINFILFKQFLFLFISDYFYRILYIITLIRISQ